MKVLVYAWEIEIFLLESVASDVTNGLYNIFFSSQNVTCLCI